MYPGSGATCDTQTPSAAPEELVAEASQAAPQGETGFGEVPPEDPEQEFATVEGEHPLSSGPRVINVGIAGPGV